MTAVGAVPVTAVVCPPWCAIPQAEHLAQLGQQEGMVRHMSADRTGEQWAVYIMGGTYADGTPDPANKPAVHVDIHSDTALPPEEGERLNAAIEAAVREVRS